MCWSAWRLVVTRHLVQVSVTASALAEGSAPELESVWALESVVVSEVALVAVALAQDWGLVLGLAPQVQVDGKQRR